VTPVVEASACAPVTVRHSANGTAHLPALTGLRFLLALWVILDHLTGPGMILDARAHSLLQPIYALIRGGYLAVTTFFVLSGFVLARSYSGTIWNRSGVMRYGVGRVARVYPVYALSLLVVAPFILADRTPHKPPLIAAHGLLVQGWLGHLPVNWNTPAWSLSCEMFFYLLFPAAALMLRRAGWRRTLAVAGAACCLTRAMWAAGIPDEIKPLIHLSDFLMGIATARAYDLLRARPRRPAGPWFYIPAAVIGAVLIADPQLLPGAIDLNSALRPLNALLIVGFGLGGGLAARLLGSRLAVYLGKSSYAMYILHVPLLWWYSRWAGRPSGALYIAGVIAVSALVYGFIEEPANRFLRGLGPSPRGAAARV
jgi:peptidoglycan/LPS O-acetylase OafA/YrhL